MDIDRLFRQYYRPLCLYANRYLRDAGRVEDVVQGAFVAYWEKCRAGLQPEQPKSYLYRIVHNRCIDDLRRSGSPLPAEGLSRELDVPDEETVDRSFVWARLWTAIDKLPERRRQILLLNKRDGLACAEIGARMGISEFTVRNQLAKALKTLRADSATILQFFLCF